MKYLLTVATGLVLGFQVQAQVFSNKEVGKKNAQLRDSLSNSEYPYILPILGAKATKRGYNLPYSAGLSINYFVQKSDLVIDNLSVGFNNGTMFNLDGIVKFNNAVAVASALTIRPDVWILPFLNIYGIFGQAQASTQIDIGIWVPDATNTPKEVLTTKTQVDFHTTTAGFGMTPTIGVGGGFIALDMNCAWTDVPQLSKPAFSYVFGPRFGKNFKLKKPGSGIAMWVGAFRVGISSETNGSIALKDVIPPSELPGKIANAETKINDAQQQVDTWWGGLTPAEQRNPVNAKKYETANNLLATAGNLVNGLDNASSTISTSTVQYSMDKQPKDAWNFIVGSQYQLNKHWMVRAEYGFLGTRTQFITGLQYRFGL